MQIYCKEGFLDRFSWINDEFWQKLFWVGVTIVAAGLIIWLLVFANRKVFQALNRKQRGIHLVFFERMNKVIIVVGVLILAVSALDSNASVWKTMLGGTAVVSAVIAFAAQDVIKDILAGLMISVQKPFEIGDRIELSDGTIGIVEDITNRHVVLRGIDTLRYIVPNSKVNSQSLTNYSFHQIARSVKFSFPIGYDSDVARAKDVIRQAIKDSAYAVPGKTDADGMPAYGDVFFIALDDSALVMTTTVYYERTTPTERLIDDIQTRVREALLANGIDIPYPHVSVVSAQPKQ